MPPDDRRRFVDRVEAKRIYRAGRQPDAHGFDFVDPAQNAASGFAAGYYAWDPKPGLRFISLETVSEGGATVGSAQGNIDDPQFRWLQGELERARAARKVVVLFGHHSIRTITSGTPDEAAPRCTGRYLSGDGQYAGARDVHGHDRNPGCDLDPRGSSPIHLGGELAGLLSANPNVVAYLAGHSHVNRVTPCGTGRGCGARGNWWEINTASTNDWPQQHRLVELMDNRDGTLSILGTPVDQGAQIALPAPGNAGGFNEDQLASLARAFAFNDPKQTKAAGGRSQDANVELIVRNPRAGRGAGLCAAPTRRLGGKRVDRALLGRLRRVNRRVYPPHSLNVQARPLLPGGRRVRAPRLSHGRNPERPQPARAPANTPQGGAGPDVERLTPAEGHPQGLAYGHGAQATSRREAVPREGRRLVSHGHAASAHPGEGAPRQGGRDGPGRPPADGRQDADRPFPGSLFLRYEKEPERLRPTLIHLACLVRSPAVATAMRTRTVAAPTGAHRLPRRRS